MKGSQHLVSALLVSLLFGVAIPCVAMAALVPSLKAHAPKTGNFRGVEVFNGLGIVWFIWLTSLWLVSILTLIIALIINDGLPFLPFDLPLATPAWLSMIADVFPLLAGTCVFGLFDDWAGDNTAKGFKGHLKALAHGHLTTGGLKFLGIGFLSLACGLATCFDYSAFSIVRGLAAAVVIALSANLMNLLDLRPGRAAKSYLIALLALFVGWTVFSLFKIAPHQLQLITGIALFIACTGPVLATWRFDLGEVGMLGDAGANTMGALLGFLAVQALPFWLLLPLAVALLLVNLLSERVSFTQIIASHEWLRKADEWGRKADVPASTAAPVDQTIAVQPVESKMEESDDALKKGQ